MAVAAAATGAQGKQASGNGNENECVQLAPPVLQRPQPALQNRKRKRDQSVPGQQQQAQQLHGQVGYAATAQTQQTAAYAWQGAGQLQQQQAGNGHGSLQSMAQGGGSARGATHGTAAGYPHTGTHLPGWAAQYAATWPLAQQQQLTAPAVAWGHGSASAGALGAGQYAGAMAMTPYAPTTWPAGVQPLYHYVPTAPAPPVRQQQQQQQQQQAPDCAAVQREAGMEFSDGEGQFSDEEGCWQGVNDGEGQHGLDRGSVRGGLAGVQGDEAPPRV